MSEQFSYSRVGTFEQCPYKYYLRYVEHLKTLDDDDPQNALYLGTALHKGIETTVEEGIQEYYSKYPIIDDRHINEAIKLEHLIPEVKKLLPENRIHEMQIQNEYFNGFLDLLVPCTKHDMELKYGQFDLYDFKYSSNIKNYLDSGQLHVYKYMLEKITGKRIRKMYFLFIPKPKIKQKQDENIQEFRNRVIQELDEETITIQEIEYDPNKVLEWFNSVLQIKSTETFQKNPSFLCRWCEYEKYCTKGIDYMILPKCERRNIQEVTKRKIWIYGGAFSGKTTFVDKAPNPLNLNTDGNIGFVTMPYLPIKDTYEGRQKKLAWQVFKDAINELEKKDNDFKTIVVDLLEDTYQSCRLYMYDKLGIEHESDDSFKAWDEVRTEYLSTIRQLMNLDYENIILISHEDTSKDIMKKSGDKITAIKPNLQDKISNKIAGMVDIVARVIVEDDGTRKLSFKSNEVIFGGGRLHGLETTEIPLDWDELVNVYEQVNSAEIKPEQAPEEESEEDEEDEEVVEEKPKRKARKAKEPEPTVEEEPEPEAEPEPEEKTEVPTREEFREKLIEIQEEKPKRRTRRTRKVSE